MIKSKTLTLFLLISNLAFSQQQTALPQVEVEGQPFGANAHRLAQALEFLGVPLDQNILKSLKFATEAAITILRIDDLIKLAPEEPEGR